ncbi:hypothetical protein PSM36_3411 [Proteiniphilum saccharofermentans]|jgi:hypothetical protein|uniref:Uncharacterized protein n=1 Tax=Proteiniphilum saccharofermentans TaxID=1642647 RepID=A0A1R3TDW4_9BACT|nr:MULTISPECIES: DUF3575 domain-containing protein [Proteiniphilum]SEA24467.1 Protein of unknown function [Porphyromonadaceae bacterium KH3R12]SFK54786.1 Protein of unknown function [Porphyromonadaceae bacterium KH3CP3RA]SFS43273.1 Protein of unknown function [Porphyromonadaceae bacterium NLAE-zl-C104]MDY9917802.1 DUF3575 domain-containing protein [Proteiniphilum sp.]SCD22195.1 hypothetical protein PSM36_3411 [Proteiniphilum saccharofermentans]
MDKSKQLIIAIVMLFSFNGISAQKAAIKTNIMADATTTMSLAAEIGTAPKNTLELYMHWNPWELSDGKLIKHLYLQPEYRFWFCEKFSGSFLGVHLHGGLFNLAGIKLPFGMYPGLKTHRYEGEFIGGGVSYGYQWVLSKHWNLEATLGAGYAYINYDRYQCGDCGKRLDKDKDKHYFGPTKAALSIVYVF